MFYLKFQLEASNWKLSVTNSMSDPFRDIVKQNAEIYRASAEAHLEHSEKVCNEYKRWVIDRQIYINILNAFSITEPFDMNILNITEYPQINFPEKKVDLLSKVK
jgi:hypothetical protein